MLSLIDTSPFASYCIIMLQINKVSYAASRGELDPPCIKNRTYRSNGYNRPQHLFNDIISRNAVSTAIIPNNISTTSKMYKKALNFTKSTDIFWKNKGPITINYTPSRSSSKLNNVDVLLTDIQSGFMLVHRIISNQPYDLPDFPSAALSSIDVATATPHSSALHMKNHSASYG